MVDIQILVAEFLAKLKEHGIMAQATYRVSQEGDIIGFTVKFTGYAE